MMRMRQRASKIARVHLKINCWHKSVQGHQRFARYSYRCNGLSVCQFTRQLWVCLQVLVLSSDGGKGGNTLPNTLKLLSQVFGVCPDCGYLMPFNPREGARCRAGGSVHFPASFSNFVGTKSINLREEPVSTAILQWGCVSPTLRVRPKEKGESQ